MSYEDVVMQQEKERLDKLAEAQTGKPQEKPHEEVKAKRPYKRRDTGADSQ